MHREKILDLQTWKDKPNRKPLLLNGARQVGKSWLVKHFGKNHFDGKFIEINLEKNRDLHVVFKKNSDVKRIIFELELLLNVTFKPGKDLFFIDEIQSCPEALISLRYFYEELPDLHLIAAGSLLDFEFRDIPFPVGRVEVLDLYPLTFYEFLLARNKQNLAQLLELSHDSIPYDVNSYFEEDFNLYLVVGGMPECVDYFVRTNDLAGVSKIQDDLWYSFQQDFKKYNPKVDTDCLLDILENSTKYIGNQIIYSKLTERFSNPTIKKGVEVLKTARILHKVQNVSVSSLPLVASGKQFKMYFLDIGLLLRISKIDYKNLFVKRELAAAFQGMLAEQFVAQQLIAKLGNGLQYWARTETGANAEVDFVFQKNNSILPIEVKAGKSGSLKSLHYLLQHHPNLSKAIVFSVAKTGKEASIDFVPIYWAGRL